MLILLLVIVFVVLSIIALVCFISLLCDFDTYTPEDAAKIKFKAFKKFYSINPERWKLHAASVTCKIVNESKSSYRGLFYEYEKEEFRFSFWDYLRYQKFLTN